MKKITLKEFEELKKLPDINLYYRISDNKESEEVETLTEHKLEEVFDQMIDESHGDVPIAGHSYNTSKALKKIDPIAYRTSLNNYAESEGWQKV